MSLNSSQEHRIDTDANKATCTDDVGGSLGHNSVRLTSLHPTDIYRGCIGAVDCSQFHMVR